MTNDTIHESWQSGDKKMEWVQSYMPVLTSIRDRFIEEKPFTGLRITMSIHLEAKTAYLATVLRSGGAEVSVTGCNPLSTQDDVADALRNMGFEVHAKYGASPEEYVDHLKAALSVDPHLIIDDGGDLIELLHGECAEFGNSLIGGCEETTTGIHRLKARSAAGKLKYPMISVNDAECKYLFDNRYGTGQSVWDAIMNTTNNIVASKNVVVAGFGWCGRGVAMRAKGLGARVTVTEVNPIRALEAAMEGYEIKTMDEAAPLGDIFISTTGCNKVITRRHYEVMKDGVLLANAGHFDVEVDKKDLESLAIEVFPRKKNITGYKMGDGRIINLLGDGRLVNLAAGNGHPAEIMDMSFGIQALCLEYLAKNGSGLTPNVYDVPKSIDESVARLKLASMGLKTDSLTPDQEEYLTGF
ncbi:MAG: adenosylhomocysteinase [Bacillota bacterium]|jgi:adenosylhomocysteinase|nr:adenosylhomocysteinase [Bacillota bacterium]